jgi:hypothetical protein
MSARLSIRLLALLAALAAGIYHVSAVHRQAHLRVDRVQLEEQAMKLRSEDEDGAGLVAAAEEDLQRLAADRASRTEAAASVAQSSAVSGNKNTPTPPTQNVGNVPKSDLLEWQVQAYISEQRLRYARLLKRLGLTSEDSHAFDRIQGAYRKLMVDPTQNAAARKQAAQTRDDQLKALFGANHEQWLEAQRNEPARFVVSQIVQQTFQGSGALTTTQAEELERIVAQHRLQVSSAPGGRRGGYDWDQIVADAQSILADQQQKDFLVAIEYRRASEQMSAMAAAK